MCIIIAKDAGVKALDMRYFSRAWDNNPHGGGIVWKDKDGEVMIQKGFMDKVQFLKRIKEINEETTAFIAHFRIKSVGEIKPENCHPFNMDNITFAHNGTLTIKPLEGKTDSETFGRAFLHDKDMSWVKEYKTLLEMAIGTSKFAIMDNLSGEIFILNRERGSEKDGAWFSNDSAFEPPKLPKTSSYDNYTGWYNRGGYNGPVYQPRMIGTKKFNIPYAHYDKVKKHFVYTATAIAWKPTGYKEPLTCDKRGLWKIADSVKPDEKLAEKEYDKDSQEIKIIAKYQKELEDLLNIYHASTFESWTERDDSEEDIFALNTVLNCCRRLIRAKKEISFESLMSFCVDNIQREKYAKPGETTYMGLVVMYAEEICSTLNKGKDEPLATTTQAVVKKDETK